MTPFDWRGFLSLADWLADRLDEDSAIPGDDAGLRTVISRAYYAAFHVARAYVDEQVTDGVLVWPATRRSIHDKVWDAVSTHPDPAISALANLGDRLKGMRTEADYSLAPNKRRRDMAIRASAYARDIITRLDAQSSLAT